MSETTPTPDVSDPGSAEPSTASRELVNGHVTSGVVARLRYRMSGVEGGRPIVVVLGMHRAGTSLLSNVLHYLGADMADETDAVSPKNAGGFWERPDIVAFHDRILEAIGRPLGSPFHALPFPPGWWRQKNVQAIKKEVIEWLERQLDGTAGLWGFKDPRTARLLPLWAEIFQQLGLQARYVVALRPPGATAVSMANKNPKARPMLALQGELMWLAYYYDVLRFTGYLKPLVVNYEDWFRDPQPNAERLVEGLGLDANMSSADFIDCVNRIVRGELRHNVEGQGLSVPVFATSTELYDAIVGDVEVSGVPAARSARLVALLETLFKFALPFVANFTRAGEFQQQLEAVQQEAGELTVRLETAARDRAEQAETATKAARQLDDLQREFAGLKEERDGLEDERKRLDVELSAGLAALKATEAELEAKAEVAELAASSAAAAKQDLAEHARFLAEARQQHATTSEQLTVLKANVVRVTAQLHEDRKKASTQRSQWLLEKKALEENLALAHSQHEAVRSKLQADDRELKEQLALLTAERDTLATKAAELSAQLDDSRLTFGPRERELSDQLEAAHAERDALSTQLIQAAALQGKLHGEFAERETALAGKLAALASERDKGLANSKAIAAEIHESKKATLAVRAEWQAEKAIFERAISEGSAERSTLAAALQEAAAGLEALRIEAVEDATKYGADLAEVESERETFRALAERMGAELRTVHGESRGRERSLSEQLSAQESEREKLRAEVRDREEDLTGRLTIIRQERDELHARVTEVSGLLEATGQERDDLHTRIAEAAGLIEATGRERDELRAQFAEAAGLLETTRQERDKLHTRITEALGLLDTVKEQADDQERALTGRLTTLSSERDDLAAAIAEAASALQAARIEHHEREGELAAQVTKLAMERDDLQASIAQTQVQLREFADTATGRESELVAALTALDDERQVLERKLSDAADRIGHLDREKSARERTYSAQLVALDQEREALRNGLVEAAAARETMQDASASREGEFAAELSVLAAERQSLLLQLQEAEPRRRRYASASGGGSLTTGLSARAASGSDRSGRGPGAIIGVEGRSVAGWAINPIESARPVLLEVLIDDVAVEVFFVAGQPGPNEQGRRFEIALDPLLSDDLPHMIAIRDADSRVELENSPLTIRKLGDAFVSEGPLVATQNDRIVEASTVLQFVPPVPAAAPPKPSAPALTPPSGGAVLAQKLDAQYRKWVAEFDAADATERQAATDFAAALDPASPVVSVVIVPKDGSGSDALQRSLASLEDQIYRKFDVVLSQGLSVPAGLTGKQVRQVPMTGLYEVLVCTTGAFIVFLGAGDTLAPAALLHAAALAVARPDVAFAYTDEDRQDAATGRRSDPLFKGEWDFDLALTSDYFCRMACIRRAVALANVPDGPIDAASVQLLLLAGLLSLDESRIAYVPAVAYHRDGRKPPETGDLAEVLGSLLAARDPAHPPQVVRLAGQGRRRIVWPVPQPAPLVSIIVPTRDQMELTRDCVSGILLRTAYANIEIIIVDNDSEKPETLAYFDEIGKHDRVSVLKFSGPFNYSAINNLGVASAKGDIILLLNNDILIDEGDWLDELVAQVSRPEVGAVGALLLYDDGTVQHAGVVLGVGGVASHIYKRHAPESDVNANRLHAVSQYSAVTAACLAVRRSVWDQVGGLSEELPVAFNDIDFCLRIRAAGFKIVWTPYARLYHLESQSRGKEDTADKKTRFETDKQRMFDRWKAEIDADPFFSPNASLMSTDGLPAFPPRWTAPWMATRPAG